MAHPLLARRAFLRTLALGGTAMAAAPLWAQENALREPVHRVAKADGIGSASGLHPLDPALALAKDSLARIQHGVADYTATIIKRERIKGVLGNYEYMFAKIRNRKVEGDRLAVPLSVYLRFLKPKDVEGREVIWVEQANNGKMRVHESGLIGRTLGSVWLDPHGALAMKGNLHPITDIGIENLVLKLIERGNAERLLGAEETEVKFIKGAKINDRVCTVLNVRHPVQQAKFEFHLAQIFIDDELQVPIRYAAFHWPTDPKDTTGPVLEEYTYLNLKLNVGLDNAAFDPENPEYNF